MPIIVIAERHARRTASIFLATSVSTSVLERSDSPVAVVPETDPSTDLTK